MSQIPLKYKLGNLEDVFIEEYIKETGNESVNAFYFPKSDNESWWCVCGCKNSIKSMMCDSCGIDIRKLGKLLKRDYLNDRLIEKQRNEDKSKEQAVISSINEKSNQIATVDNIDNTDSSNIVENKKCPECEFEVSSSCVVCPICGYPLDEASSNSVVPVKIERIRCKECGEMLESKAICPVCGFDNNTEPIKNHEIAEINASGSQTNHTGIISIRFKLSQLIRKRSNAVGIVLLALSVICVVVAVNNVTNSDYAFLKEHYEECQQEQQECRAKKASTLSWLRSTYDSLISDYQDMMDDDMKDIWWKRIKSIIILVIAVLSLIMGIRLIRKRYY